jgi:hypothetical protein
MKRLDYSPKPVADYPNIKKKGALFPLFIFFLFSTILKIMEEICVHC